MYIYKYIYIYLYTYVHTCLYMYIRIYIYVQICTHKHTYIYKYIHTHRNTRTHTYINKTCKISRRACVLSEFKTLALPLVSVPSTPSTLFQKGSMFDVTLRAYMACSRSPPPSMLSSARLPTHTRRFRNKRRIQGVTRYRVAKIHAMPYLCRLFSTKEPHN